MGSTDSSTSKISDPQMAVPAGHRRSYSGGGDIDDQVRGLLGRGSNSEIQFGQSQTRQCACRLNNRSPHDDTIAIHGMSNIFHTAEAIYEAVDEISGHSLSLLSQPSSVPAPHQVVEALSVKRYCKLQKHFSQEDPQCYICLVEYAEGDEIRMLPCNHEYHKFCIDEWLKNVHRICPVCRHDVCKSGSSHTESR